MIAATLLVKLVTDASTCTNNAFRVHTHDRLMYRGCRRKWKWGSNMIGCHGLETDQRISPLWLGSGVHYALQHLYHADPEKRISRDALPGAMDAYALDWWKEHPETSEWDIEENQRFQDDLTLGKAMLNMYKRISAEMDDFELIASEVPFQVPVRDFHTGEPLTYKCVHSDGSWHMIPVLYEGRIDGIVRREGRLWLLEHKTFKSFDVRKLENDDQVSSYIWAAWLQYGWDIAGVIYNVLKKKTPVIPPVVYRGKKNEGISRAKDVIESTTYDLYKFAIERGGYKVEDYASELARLQEYGWYFFFARETVRRTRAEILETGRRIYGEVREMMGHASLQVEDVETIYPNPDQIRCSGCAFRSPCLALSSGDDYGTILRESYRRRTPTDIQREDVETMPI